MSVVQYASHQILLGQPFLVVGLPLDVSTGVPRRLKAKTDDRPFWAQKDGAATAFRIGEISGLPGWYGVNLWWVVGSAQFPPFPDEPIASGANTVEVTGDPSAAFPVHGSNGDLAPPLAGARLSGAPTGGDVTHACNGRVGGRRQRAARHRGVALRAAPYRRA